MITKDEVRHISHLARIDMDDNKLLQYTKNLEDIIHYIDKLSQVNIQSTKPTSHVLPLKNVFRADKIRPSLDRKTVLEISPEHLNGSFKVPQVIE